MRAAKINNKMAFEKEIAEFPWVLAICNRAYSLKRAVRIWGWLGKLYGILFFIGGACLMAQPSLREMDYDSNSLVYVAASVNFLFGLLCFISGLVLRWKVQGEEEVSIFRTLRVVSIVFSILDFPMAALLWVGIWKSNKGIVKTFIIYRCVLMALFFLVFILSVTYGFLDGGLTITKYVQGLAILVWFHFTVSANVLYLNMMYIKELQSVVTHMQSLVENSEKNSTKTKNAAENTKTTKQNQMGWVIPNLYPKF